MRKTSSWQLLVATILYTVTGAASLGSMSTIAASYGDAAIVCAVEASRGQQVLCWGASAATTSLAQPFLALSGGNGFMCGLTADGLQPFCWRGNNTGQNLVPQIFQATRYQELAAGEDHVCATRKTGTDCWRINGGGNIVSNITAVDSIVAGRGFSCGVARRTKRAVCWGERNPNAGAPRNESFESLAVGRDHVCGIVSVTRTVVCWGENTNLQASPPPGVAFAAITAGVSHSCGILNASHEVLCWGSTAAAAPQGAQFVALAASENFTCGVRARNLLATCWGVRTMEPPLQLFSPGICARRECSRPGEFAFNLSVIDSATQLPSICLQGAANRICLPCATSCPHRTFMSAPCSPSLDLECTDCSMCKNSDPCQAVCGHTAAPSHIKVAVAAASATSVVICSAICLVLLLRRRNYYHHHHHHLFRCFRSHDADPTLMQSSSCATSMSSPTLCTTQAFRLTELRDATNGFKEANELGRGTYGSVYKAILPDGRKVAVKRANAARRIHCRSRDFESELDVLCRVRHAQLVNLVGFCEEMGERILVYEFMANGTLHDHLHGGLTQLRSWGLRFRIAVQAARGVEYLHRDASPRILHKDIKSSNILLDGDWNARVADFGLSHTATNQITDTKLEESPRSPIHHLSVNIGPYTDPTLATSPVFTEKSDVYSFGVVLLELLSGRRAHEEESSPPSIVDWARKAIQEGATRTLLDPALDPPKHVEPLLRVAEIAALCVRADPEERPSLPDVVLWLELVGRGSFV